MGTNFKNNPSLFRYFPCLAYVTLAAAILAGSPADAGQNGDAAGRTPWTLTGSLLHERYSFQATTLLDGRVLVEGGTTFGFSGMLKSSEIFDPVSKTWTGTGKLRQARSSHTATLLADGRVLVAGGSGEDGRAA